ncbi:MAG: hypothetical protein EP330_09525 [Deltaproteobacteria bacterium]|nr:MAG: hypothetical protein EP330_09525 [Deltaproteobacteria bacterium]
MRWYLPLGLLACAAPTVDDPAGPVDVLALLREAKAVPLSREVDIGAPRARAALGDGWSGDELAGETSFVWALGNRATLSVDLPFSGAGQLAMRVKGWPDPSGAAQRVTVRVNGKEVGVIDVPAHWSEHALEVPAGVLEKGVNQVELLHATAREPGELRPISAAWDMLQFAPLVARPLVSVDIGTAEGRAALDAGTWSGDEADHGRSFVWTTAIEASLRVPEPLTQGCMDLELIGRSVGGKPQQVTVSLDGAVFGAGEVGTSWTRFRVSGQVGRGASHLLTLAGTRVEQPGGVDARRLGIAWDRVDFRACENEQLLPGTARTVWAMAGAETALTYGPVLTGEVEVQVTEPAKGVVASTRLDARGGELKLAVEGPLHPVELRFQMAGDGVTPVSVSKLELVGGGVLPAERPNLVVVLLDTVRADHLSVYGYERPTTPKLEAFAREAVVYERAWANSPWTRASVATLFTGQLPRRHGTVGRRDALTDNVRLLAEVARSAGYDTASFVTNGNVGPAFGFDRGFETYHGYSEVRDSPTFHEPAENVVDDVAAWLARRDGDDPFLLYVHLTDPHAPYAPPGPFREAFAPDVPQGPIGSNPWVQARAALEVPTTPEDVRHAVDLYDAEIAYTDAQVGRLFDELRAAGAWEGSMVVVTSDHGEEFMEHGGWEHGQTLYHEVLDVPLIVRFPDGHAGREARRAQLVDVFPTLLGAAGVPADPRDGVDLASAAQGLRPAHASVVLDSRDGDAYVAGDVKAIDMLVDRRPGGPTREVYDLAKDPTELHDLHAADPAAHEPLFAPILEKRGVKGHETSTVEMSPELEETLRALGYLE